MRSFKKYNKLDTKNAPKWAVELFKFYNKEFDEFWLRMAKRNISFLKDTDTLFKILWSGLLSIVTYNLNNYVSTKTHADNPAAERLSEGPRIKEGSLKNNDDLFDLALRLHGPVIYVMKEAIQPVRYSEIIAQSYAELIDNQLNNTENNNLQSIIKSEVMMSLRKIYYHEKIVSRKKGYYKLIGEILKPTYQKYKTHFGKNRRGFINQYRELIIESFRFNPNEFNIRSLERYLG